jgi:alpha-L-fucosidase 2
MMIRKAAYTRTLGALIVFGSLSVPVLASAASPALSFAHPAAKWTEAIPLGNGRIGAMDFGGVEDERFQVNETTLWGGYPNDYVKQDAAGHLDEVRSLIFQGKITEAEKAADALMGSPKLLMPYEPFCDLRLHFPKSDALSAYHRGLDLTTAVANTDYTVGGVSFHRESFVSFPDQALVIRMTASTPGQLTFTLGMDSPQPGTQVSTAAGGILQLTGQIQPRQNSPRSWTGSWDQPGVSFAARLKVLTDGGMVQSVGDHLEIVGANAVTLVFTNATSFRNYRDISGDPVSAVRNTLDRAVKKSYTQLLGDHIADFRTLFSRVQLQLGSAKSQHSDQPTDERIHDFADTDDPALLALYFEFGRYLLISSSRPGGQAANLQGIWNDQMTPPWGSKWTTNINLQMNYWQADAGDLGETEEPLWALIGDLRRSGAVTAEKEYHAKGWVLHHNTDLWRATAPVDGAWGIWPMGQAWLANQMWDHYLYTGDREFLVKQAYPAMKEAAEFTLSSLVEVPAGLPFAGKLVTSPSTSPENTYLLDGKRSSLTYAPTMDLELIRELFENTRAAAHLMGKDTNFSAQLQSTQERLPPLQVGAKGQLQEWIQDFKETDPHHRHMSHLYSLYPGHDIDLEKTPTMAAAAHRSMELRGDGSTGWSDVWRIGLWARLHDAEGAYTNLKLLLTKMTLPNMFDLCPPFQIDGNLGGPAVIMEMLVQSTPNEITLLPALPSRWDEGSLKGVRVRGGGKVDIVWDKGRLKEFRLQANHDAKYRVNYDGKTVSINVKSDKPVVLNASLQPSHRY